MGSLISGCRFIDYFKVCNFLLYDQRRGMLDMANFGNHNYIFGNHGYLPGDSTNRFTVDRSCHKLSPAGKMTKIEPNKNIPVCTVVFRILCRYGPVMTDSSWLQEHHTTSDDPGQGLKLMKWASDHRLDLVDPSGSRSSRLPSPFDTTLHNDFLQAVSTSSCNVSKIFHHLALDMR